MSQQPIRVGMLGAGLISDYHLTGLQQAGAELVSIFSRTPAKARAKAAQFWIPHYTADYTELLGRADVAFGLEKT